MVYKKLLLKSLLVLISLSSSYIYGVKPTKTIDFEFQINPALKTLYPDIAACSLNTSELKDVTVSSLANNECLRYNSTTSKWVNSSSCGSIDLPLKSYTFNLIAGESGTDSGYSAIGNTFYGQLENVYVPRLNGFISNDTQTYLYSRDQNYLNAVYEVSVDSTVYPLGAASFDTNTGHFRRQFTSVTSRLFMDGTTYAMRVSTIAADDTFPVINSVRYLENVLTFQYKDDSDIERSTQIDLNINPLVADTPDDDDEFIFSKHTVGTAREVLNFNLTAAASSFDFVGYSSGGQYNDAGSISITDARLISFLATPFFSEIIINSANEDFAKSIAAVDIDGTVYEIQLGQIRQDQSGNFILSLQYPQTQFGTSPFIDATTYAIKFLIREEEHFKVDLSSLRTAIGTGGGGLTETQVDARVIAGVLDWAETGNTDLIPVGKLGSGTADNTKVLYGDGTWKDEPSGGTTFTPTQQNLYSSVKDIFVSGTNTTLTEDDMANTIAVNATSGGTTVVANPSSSSNTLLSYVTIASTDYIVGDAFSTWALDGNITIIPTPKLGTGTATLGRILRVTATGQSWQDYDFLGLEGTPSSWGTDGQFIAYDVGSNGLAFVDAPSGGGATNTQKDAFTASTLDTDDFLTAVQKTVTPAGARQDATMTVGAGGVFFGFDISTGISSTISFGSIADDTKRAQFIDQGYIAFNQSGGGSSAYIRIVMKTADVDYPLAIRINGVEYPFPQGMTVHSDETGSIDGVAVSARYIHWNHGFLGHIFSFPSSGSDLDFNIQRSDGQWVFANDQESTTYLDRKITETELKTMVYNYIKEIIQEGTNITKTEDDINQTITINGN